MVNDQTLLQHRGVARCTSLACLDLKGGAVSIRLKKPTCRLNIDLFTKLVFEYEPFENHQPVFLAQTNYQ
jgi:hypothetical protein